MPRRRIIRNRRGRRNGTKNGGKSSKRWWEENCVQSPVFNRTIRYVATAAFNSYITARCILNSVVAFDSVASAEAVLIMDSIKLRRVKIAYLSTTGLGTDTAEVGFTWFGEHGPEQRITSRGTSFCPAEINKKPKKGTFAGMWFNLQDNIESILFNCDLPQYSLLEINYSFTLAEGTDSNAIAATNPGTGLWYAALDNSTVAPALAGLLLRPDYLAYITLTGVTTPVEELEVLRKKLLREFEEKLLQDEKERRKTILLDPRRSF